MYVLSKEVYTTSDGLNRLSFLSLLNLIIQKEISQLSGPRIVLLEKKNLRWVLNVTFTYQLLQFTAFLLHHQPKKKLGKHCTYIQSERGVSQSAFIWNALSKYCRKMLAPKDQQRLARLSPYISALDFLHFLVELSCLKC